MKKKFVFLFQSVLICFMFVSSSALACLTAEQNQNLIDIANSTGVNSSVLIGIFESFCDKDDSLNLSINNLNGSLANVSKEINQTNRTIMNKTLKYFFLSINYTNSRINNLNISEQIRDSVTSLIESTDSKLLEIDDIQSDMSNQFDDQMRNMWEYLKNETVSYNEFDDFYDNMTYKQNSILSFFNRYTEPPDYTFLGIFVILAAVGVYFGRKWYKDYRKDKHIMSRKEIVDELSMIKHAIGLENVKRERKPSIDLDELSPGEEEREFQEFLKFKRKEKGWTPEDEEAKRHAEKIQDVKNSGIPSLVRERLGLPKKDEKTANIINKRRGKKTRKRKT